ncbi:glycosyl transferase family 90-domain-containing protein [Pyrenochaeta sp. MPI-SDFR-AT-0127]|nr:glycosyl transferase family 90-domain-containing protein [Pyrenochaeta sp. MPI-SDFR-AT-0127]
MARIRIVRQLLPYIIGIFCVLGVFTTGILFRLFYDNLTTEQLPRSRFLPKDTSPLHVAFSNPQEPVLPGASESHNKKKTIGLSPVECRTEFPALFAEIDRSVSLRKDIGDVASADIDLSWKQNGAVRVLICNQKLYVIEAKFDDKGYQRPRFLATLHQLNRAITSSPFSIPCIEFSFVVDDIPDESHTPHPIWAFSRHVSLDREIWPMPDFGYWSWPLELVGEYGQIRSEMMTREVDWDTKVPKVFWRGALKTNKEIRGALLEATKGKEWADVEEVTWKNRDHVSDKSTALSITEHCKYQFLVHTEGRSYSGRGKYLLNCASILITHRADWIEPHSHLFVSSGPDQNVVMVERDFSDLEEKMEDLLQNPLRGMAIANNSVATFRDKYLTPAAETCYWRQLFLSWANVSFSPNPWVTDKDWNRKIRGTPFETFVVESLDKCSWWKEFTHRC